MKRIFFSIILIVFSIAVSAQPSSINYKKSDFVGEVLSNPNFSLGDFLSWGINSKTCRIGNWDVYQKNEAYQNECRSKKMNPYETYKKIKASWEVLLIIENQNWEDAIVNWDQNNIFAPRVDPELRHRVHIVPLKLKEY